MRKYFFAALSLLLVPFFSNAQSMSMKDMLPKTATYYIKGGTEIPYSKVDSVIASWPGGFNMEHQGNTIYLSPTTAADTKATEALKTRSAAWAGKTAPDFRLTDMNGKERSLSGLKGKVIVLNFWFTSCTPCMAELPELNRIKKKFEGKNVIFLGIGRDTRLQIGQFLKKHRFDYTLIPNGIKTAADYQVEVYPTSFVIDQQGTIRFAQATGENVASGLPAAINALL